MKEYFKHLLWKEYKENEKQNLHTENYLMLATHFGTEKQLKRVEEIMEHQETKGYITEAQSHWMYKTLNKHYSKLLFVFKVSDKQISENEIVKRAEKINAMDLGKRLNFRVHIIAGTKRISGYTIYSDYRYSAKSEPIAENITKKEANKFFDKVELKIKNEFGILINKGGK